MRHDAPTLATVSAPMPSSKEHWQHAQQCLELAKEAEDFYVKGTRYERRSMLITANQPFGAWSKVFPDQAMTLAAIDRLVHHSTILEMNVESYRRRAALDRKRGRGRAPTHATIKDRG
jgi:IstB-like ATP binding protein